MLRAIVPIDLSFICELRVKQLHQTTALKLDLNESNV
jgi:hypothetical protein